MMRIERNSSVSPRRPLPIALMEAPEPIHVDAENFQKLVQNLTAGKRRRKTVRCESVDEARGVRIPFSQPAKVRRRIYTLMDYLDLLDEECAPPSNVSENQGFFPTAGLVKGVNVEEGLQPLDISPDSPRTPLSSFIHDQSSEESSPSVSTTGSFGSFDTVFTPLDHVPSPTSLCPEWDEGPGCLSPCSYEVMKHARTTRKHALKACGNVSGSGPMTLSLQKIGDQERVSSPGDWGYPHYPVDLLYYKGEVIFASQTGE